MITKIDHIGIAVQSLDKAIRCYEETFGLKCAMVEEIASQKVKVALFKIGDVHIELLEPTSTESPIAKYIEKRGPGIHHIAYHTDNIEKQLAKAKSAGCKLINGTPTLGAHSKQIAFLHPESTFGVLTELCSNETSCWN